MYKSFTINIQYTMSLPRAVQENNREEVERLLRSGSDVNEKDEVQNRTFSYVYQNAYVD